MKSTLYRAVVSGTGSFLPNAPVPNDRIDDVLGTLTAAPARVQEFVKTVGARMLQTGGVEHRHFAVDPETHRLTHTLASLAEQSARQALAHAGRKPQDVDLLLLSSPNYDRGTPPTSTLLQERLGIEQCAEMEVHSNCSGVGKTVQIAYDALRLGRYKTALVVYPQMSSTLLRGSFFKQGIMTKTQAALRYILADGSGALFLEAANGDGEARVPHEILGTHIESCGGKREPGMTAGGGVEDFIEPRDIVSAVYDQGRHHLDQDFAAVSRDATPFLTQGVRNMLAALGMRSSEIDHYVYSIPTRQLYDGNLERVTTDLGVGPERVKFRARDTGYCGGASVLLHLDEMVRSGELQSGQTAVVYSVESSKWMSGGFVVRW